MSFHPSCSTSFQPLLLHTPPPHHLSSLDRVQVMPLCTKAVIDRNYTKLNTVQIAMPDGGVLHLFSQLLAMLLRLSSLRGADPDEIARRTKEVLDQFERNEDQAKVFRCLLRLSLDPKPNDSLHHTHLGHTSGPQATRVDRIPFATVVAQLQPAALTQQPACLAIFVADDPTNPHTANPQTCKLAPST